MREHGRRCAILLGGKPLYNEQLEYAAQTSAATGAQILSDILVPKTQRGGGRFPTTKVSYPIKEPTPLLADLDAKAPVSFFAYLSEPFEHPHPTWHPELPGGSDRPHSCSALAELKDLTVGASLLRPTPLAVSLPTKPTGWISGAKFTIRLASTIPENAIVIDQIGTSGPPLQRHSNRETR